MLQHAKSSLEDETILITTHRIKFHNLMAALLTPVANEYTLDKKQRSFNDILDAFRLALIFYKRTKD
jgi:hypothetical protein